jgi:hypothetical protein
MGADVSRNFQRDLYIAQEFQIDIRSVQQDILLGGITDTAESNPSEI